jgi:methyl-branched lipid omega-hydroxylase
MANPSPLADPVFWQQPLADRMTTIAELRAEGPFHEVQITNPRFEGREKFWAVLGFDEVMEISRRPQEFCSGEGAVSIFGGRGGGGDMGMFINMDDPRHARQRGIVSRSFTPRSLQGVLDSVESIANELIDGICERGEVDLVETVSQPFPLLIICDMMGIPRSEFPTVLKATNAILGAGDPEMTGVTGEDDMAGMMQAFMNLMTLFNELVEDRRVNPREDLTSMLVHNDADEDMLTEGELAGFFILLAVAGNDTTRNAISHGVHLLSRFPDQKKTWLDDIDGVATTATEEIVRYASPVTFMRRTLTTEASVSGHEFTEGEKVVLFYGAANRDPKAFADPEAFDVRRNPNAHVGFGGPGPHFCLGAHLARREISTIFRLLHRRLPDLEVIDEPTPLAAATIPLVGGLKRVPVRFTPTKPVGGP